MRLLVAEDDRRLAGFVANGLREEGCAVDLAHDGDQAVALAMSGLYEVVILDILMPKRSGFEVIRELRSKGVKTPILCLTARDGLDDRITGLNLGADDYLVKPFAFGELLARVRALARRTPGMVPQELQCGDLVLDPTTRRVSRAGTPIRLTAKEFALLEFLMRRVGTVVIRTLIIESVWDIHFDALTNVVEVFMSRLRDKVDKPFGKKLIHTVRGVGYVLREPEDDK